MSADMNYNALLTQMLSVTSVREPAQTANRLREAFGSFSSICDADAAKLLAVRGVTQDAAVLLRLLPELLKRAFLQQNPLPDRVTDPLLGYYAVARFFGENRERTLTVMGAKGRPPVCHETPCCTENEVNFCVSDIIDRAVSYGADTLVIIHNHPGGFAVPSAADNATLSLLGRLCRELNIQIYDHIIVADGDFVSMRDSTDLGEKK